MASVLFVGCEATGKTVLVRRISGMLLPVILSSPDTQR